MLSRRQLLVWGESVDLENLYRLVRNNPERREEIVAEIAKGILIAHLPDGIACLELVRSSIFPRVASDSVFDKVSRDTVAHLPFVNGTSILFMLDFPSSVISITVEDLLRWGVTIEELDQIARRNLSNRAPNLSPRIIEVKAGEFSVMLEEKDSNDAARILLPDLYSRLAPQLGGDFLVGLPTRDVFVAVRAAAWGQVRELEERIGWYFRNSAFPLSRRLFLVTRDGVAGTEISIDT